MGRQALPKGRPLGPARAACQRERRLGGPAGRRRRRNLRGTAGSRRDDLYTFDEGHGGYLVPAAGAVVVRGIRVEAGEGLAIRNEPTVTIQAAPDAELVFVVTRNSAV